MEVKCSVCGKKETITKIHQEYQKLAKQPEALYVCEFCKFRINFQAKESQKQPKPI